MFNSLVGTQTPTYKVWNFTGSVGTAVKPKVGLEDDCPSVNFFLVGTSQIDVWLPTNPPPGKVIKIVNVNNTNIGGTYPNITVYSQTNPLTVVTAVGVGQSVDLMYVPDAVVYASNANASIKWIALKGATNAASSASAYGYVSGGALSGAGCGVNGTGSTVAGGNYNFASGVGSFVGGGTNNYTEQSYGTVCGGNANYVATSYATIAGGANNQGYVGSYAVIGGGSDNNYSGGYATVGGGWSNASTDSYATVSGGYDNSANGFASTVVGGWEGDTKTVSGAIAFPAHASGTGKVQSTFLQLGLTTTDNTPTVLTSEGATSASPYNCLVLNNAPSAATVTGYVVAFCSTTGDAKQWEFSCLIKRVAGGTVSLVGSPTITSTYADAGASAWSIALSANNTNKTLEVTATGDATNSVAWSCKIDANQYN